MLRCQFEMKDLGLTTFCLGLQIEHLSNGILLHQSSYIHKKKKIHRKIHLSKLLEKCTYRKQRETFHLTSIVIQNLIPTSDETDDIIIGTNGTPSTSYAIKKEEWNNSTSYQKTYLKISEALATVS